jgi:hypothetical protein
MMWMMKYRVSSWVGGLAVVAVVVAFVASCANMASPNGGPYDETPPRFVRSTPQFNQTNFTGKKIEIIFDELIQIEKPSENVIITPPQKNLPEIRTAGKKIVVELKDLGELEDLLDAKEYQEFALREREGD